MSSQYSVGPNDLYAIIYGIVCEIRPYVSSKSVQIDLGAYICARTGSPIVVSNYFTHDQLSPEHFLKQTDRYICIDGLIYEIRYCCPEQHVTTTLILGICARFSVPMKMGGSQQIQKNSSTNFIECARKRKFESEYTDSNFRLRCN
jgi:hypothetical protein